MTYEQWLAAYRRSNPGAPSSATTRNLFWYWRYRQNDPVPGSLDNPEFQSWAASTGRAVPPPSSPTESGGSGTTAETPPSPINVQSRMDAGQEARISALYQTLFGLPGVYNAQRQIAGANTQANLLDQGYFDTASLEGQVSPSNAFKTAWDWTAAAPITQAQGTPGTPNTTDLPAGSTVQTRKLNETPYAEGEQKPEGNVNYRLKVGPDGRLYRQAYMKVADTMASRGVYSSSLIGDANRQNQQSLDASRDANIRGYNNTVFSLGQQQAQATTDTQTGIDTERGNYTTYQATNDAVLPGGANTGSGTTTGAPASGAAGTPTAPTTTTPAAAPPPSTVVPVGGRLGVWTRKAAGANAVPRLRKAVRTRNKGVSFKIVRRGNRYVAVRTK